MSAATAASTGASAAAADPDSVWFYMDSKGQQRGPTTPFIIADLLQERSINSSTYGWRAGLAEWQPLSTLPELKGIFATAFDAPDDAATTAAKKGGGKGNTARPAGAAAAGGAAAAAAGSSTAAAAASAAHVDPLAVWYYLDKYRVQQGPVRAEEIVRLYKLLQLNDASLVWSGTSGAAGATAAAGSASVATSWLRLAECPAFEGLIGPEVLEASKAEREAFQAAEAAKEASKKRKREKQAANATAGTKWKKNANHSNVYVTGLPLDVTVDELLPIMKKGGILQTDAETGAPAIKIYTDPATGGKLKGDALVKYALPASVELAVELLDGYVFRAGVFKGGEQIAPPVVIHVQKAEFEMKGGAFDASKVDARIAQAAANKKAKLAGGVAAAEAKRAEVGAMTTAEIAKQRLAESLSWAEDDDFETTAGGGGGSSKLRIVILRPMFTLEEAAAHPQGEEAFYAELKNEIGAEVESKVSKAVGGASSAGTDNERGALSRGCIEKLTVFCGNASGPVAVKFRSSAQAAACIALMNGHMFAGQKLAAFYFDGKTNYVVQKNNDSSSKEEANGNAEAAAGGAADDETDKRLDEFGDWIERQGDVHDEDE